MDDDVAGAGAGSEVREPLVDRLFGPVRGWGWEYRAPEPARPSPEADRAPRWQEPPPPVLEATDFLPWKNLARIGPANVAGVLAGVAMLAVLWLGGGSGRLLAIRAELRPVRLLLLVVTAVGVVCVAARYWWPRRRMHRVVVRARLHRDAAYAAYDGARRAWAERVAAHDRAERARIAAAPIWHAVVPAPAAARVEVVGGLADGWAGLLATAGCSLLADGGGGLTVVDLTEQRVAGELAAFAAVRGSPVDWVDLPGQWPRWDPVAGLPADELVELLADAVHGTRHPAGTAEARALDGQLLDAVVQRLDGPWTLPRISAGLAVLRRASAAGGGLLGAVEAARLAAEVDAIGRVDQVEPALRYLGGVLGLLAGPGGVPAGEPGAAPAALRHAAGLTVLCTTGRHERAKDVLDRVVFGRLLCEVRDHTGGGAAPVLVIAGADHLGRAGLEALTRQARRAGVRLVLLLERLRGELPELVGGQDSAVVLMRLGNGREAAAAAEFVGRGHRFVVSQLTAQLGRTLTEGTAVTLGGSDTVTATDGRSTGVALSAVTMADATIAIPSVSGTRSSSVGRSLARSWQDTVNRSVADAASVSRTVSRVYELTIEATALQALPPTAFVLVEAGAAGRRVVFADCNPAISLLDGHAPGPAGELP